jgi:hypothetical protein
MHFQKGLWPKTRTRDEVISSQIGTGILLGDISGQFSGFSPDADSMYEVH